MEDSKILIACELGYEKEVVQFILREKTFQNAGSFLEYLCELELKDNFDDIKEKIRQEKEQEVKEPENQRQDLQKETLSLYLRSKCLKCKTNTRNIVCLPCSHYSLCKPCSSFLNHCPMCNSFISETIIVFLA